MVAVGVMLCKLQLCGILALQSYRVATTVGFSPCPIERVIKFFSPASVFTKPDYVFTRAKAKLEEQAVLRLKPISFLYNSPRNKWRSYKIKEKNNILSPQKRTTLPFMVHKNKHTGYRKNLIQQY